MTIHMSAVCKISQDLRYLSPARCRRPIGSRSISSRDEVAESSGTACEIADEVRPNPFVGLDVWTCGELESVLRRRTLFVGETRVERTTLPHS